MQTPRCARLQRPGPRRGRPSPPQADPALDGRLPPATFATPKLDSAYVVRATATYGQGFPFALKSVFARLPAVTIKASEEYAAVHPLPEGVAPVTGVRFDVPSPYTRGGPGLAAAPRGSQHASEVTVVPLGPQLFVGCPFPRCSCCRTLLSTAGVADPHSYLLPGGGVGIVVGLDLQCTNKECGKTRFKSWHPEVLRRSRSPPTGRGCPPPHSDLPLPSGAGAVP